MNFWVFKSSFFVFSLNNTIWTINKMNFQCGHKISRLLAPNLEWEGGLRLALCNQPAFGRTYQVCCVIDFCKQTRLILFPTQVSLGKTEHRHLNISNQDHHMHNRYSRSKIHQPTEDLQHEQMRFADDGVCVAVLIELLPTANKSNSWLVTFSIHTDTILSQRLNYQI